MVILMQFKQNILNTSNSSYLENTSAEEPFKGLQKFGPNVDKKKICFCSSFNAFWPKLFTILARSDQIKCKKILPERFSNLISKLCQLKLVFFLSYLIDIHSFNIRKERKLNRFPARFHYNQKVLRKSSQFFILKPADWTRWSHGDISFVFSPRPHISTFSFDIKV